MGEVEGARRGRWIGKGPRCVSQTWLLLVFFFPTGNGDPSEVTVRGNDLPRTVVSKDNCGGRKGSQKEQD